MKRSLVILFSFILISSFFISGTYAQDVLATDTNVAENNLPVEVPENTLASSVGEVSSDEIPESELENGNEDDKVAELVEEARGFNGELSVGAGITPGSTFEFIDDAFDTFASDSNLREERIAEMQVLAPQCGQGNQRACDNMRNSFDKYQRHAENFERDVSPEQGAEAKRSSEAVRGIFVREIAPNLPPTLKDEFVIEIVRGEKDIEIAAEIAGKIQELCEQLAGLDPNKYSEICRIEGDNRDAPDWRKKLDRDLTEKQREEALKFGGIMSQCFETAGQNCRCEDISFPDFAEACSIAAPLATACEIENNEEACKQLDNLEMPELPDYLQDIMDELERGMAVDKYGMFFPEECEEANAKTPEECAKVMIQTHAPEECRQALLDANVRSEGEGREICEKIMFKANAPEECVAAGITNPKECGNFMFEQNAPRECVEAGITGEGKDDSRKCQQIMESKFSGGEFGGPSCAPGTICVPGSQWAPGTGPNIQMSGGNCAGIQNSEERLKCYDGAGNYVQEYREDFKGNFEDTQNQQRKCAEDCGRKNSAWDFSGGNCVCKAPNFQEYQQKHVDNFRQDFNAPGVNEFRGDFKDGQYYSPQQPINRIDSAQPQQYNQQPSGDYQQYNQPPQNYQQPSTTSTGPSTSGTTTTEPSTSTTTEPAPTSSPEPAPSSEPSPVTGGVISNNKFLRFWFWG